VPFDSTEALAVVAREAAEAEAARLLMEKVKRQRRRRRQRMTFPAGSAGR
jgi:hypothetical protein